MEFAAAQTTQTNQQKHYICVYMYISIYMVIYIYMYIYWIDLFKKMETKTVPT